MSAEADQTVVARDPGVPGLGVVLDAGAMVALYARSGGAPGESARITYVRYKPGTSCLTSVDLDVGDSVQTFVARAFATDAGGQAAMRGAVTHAREAGALAYVDADHHVVLSAFPHDRAIPGLARLHDPALRARLYERLQLPTAAGSHAPRRLVYKPGRRYVAAVDVSGAPVAALKCSTMRDAERLGPIPSWLDGSAGVIAAPLLAEHPRRAIRAMAWLPGTLLADRLTSVDDCRADVRRVGSALAALHAGPADGASASAINGWSRRPDPTDAQSLRAVVRDVAWLLPSEARRLTMLADALVSASPPVPAGVAPIHGDFYAKQVLVEHDRIGLIDFDEATLGDPHLDLALFLAHLERDVCRGRLSESGAAQARTAFLEGYADAGGVCAPILLEGRLAEALLRLAPHPFRHREPAWPARIRALIDRAERAYERAYGRACERADQRAATRTGKRGTTGASTHDETLARLVGESAAHLDGACTSLAADASLGFAASLLDPHVARSALHMRCTCAPHEVRSVRDVGLVRHKAGRRAVLRFDLSLEDGRPAAWYGKVRVRGADTRVHRLALRLREAGLDGGDARVGIPRPCGVVAPFRLTLQERAPGVVATDLLLGSTPSPTLGAQMAAAMCALHGAQVRAGRSRTVADECATLQARLDGWAVDEPSVAPTLALLAQRCWHVAQPLRDRTVVVLLHRDLHPDQLLIDDERSWLLDLDLAADGDPALDAGNMLAHLLELGVRRPDHAVAISTVAERFAASALDGAEGHLTADALARYALLSLARLCEIARRYPERRATVPRLLGQLLHLTGRPIDLDVLCRTMLTETIPCA
jgi:aminoglycoside phosphotransferase (APT) family kinase protein